jgi:hypothetical protein
MSTFCAREFWHTATYGEAIARKALIRPRLRHRDSPEVAPNFLAAVTSLVTIRKSCSLVNKPTLAVCHSSTQMLMLARLTSRVLIPALRSGGPGRKSGLISQLSVRPADATVNAFRAITASQQQNVAFAEEMARYRSLCQDFSAVRSWEVPSVGQPSLRLTGSESGSFLGKADRREASPVRFDFLSGPAASTKPSPSPLPEGEG